MLLDMILGKGGSCGICLLRFEGFEGRAGCGGGGEGGRGGRGKEGGGRSSFRLLMSSFERGVGRTGL